jgi:Flp pilus assembly protein TadD
MKYNRCSEKTPLKVLAIIGTVALSVFLGPLQLLAAEDEEIFSPYLAARRLPEAEESRFAALRPSNPDETDAARFAETVRTGVLLVKYGQYDKAVQLLEPYRTNDQFTLQHALGVAYLRLNRNQEAYDNLVRAHHLRPNVAGPLLPAALACAKMARRCDDYRDLAQEYKKLGGRFTRLADRIAYHVPIALNRRIVVQ